MFEIERCCISPLLALLFRFATSHFRLHGGFVGEVVAQVLLNLLYFFDSPCLPCCWLGSPYFLLFQFIWPHLAIYNGVFVNHFAMKPSKQIDHNGNINVIIISSRIISWDELQPTLPLVFETKSHRIKIKSSVKLLRVWGIHKLSTKWRPCSSQVRLYGETIKEDPHAGQQMIIHVQWLNGVL